MNIYVWRHNKTYHSHSMIEEPCLNSEFYLDAIAIVVASSLEEALEKLAEQKQGWRVEDLKAHPARLFLLTKLLWFSPNFVEQSTISKIVPRLLVLLISLNLQQIKKHKSLHL